MDMGWAQWTAIAVALLRIAELIHARRNHARLLDAGGEERHPGHYPFFVLLHSAWIAALFFLVRESRLPDPTLLAIFGMLQCGRLWIIASLGRFWTTRIVTLPGAPLVRRGPYRWIRHPNYLLVAVEIPLLPLAFGAWDLALLFGFANLVLLAYRIRAEEDVLAERR
ncbi:isoprenylcysteine carboxyl methyltransferase family protein [Nisaea sediminum]|uniref:isoprenylcysteine carboxyl methyltransferase family protein n=1 Tax=Nisaea sediminum TaxID=2775867 RepID=UPI001868E4F6|nr:isoprenylcysteine carboxylmethyltransferase family protein [Nisaea sediminum]